VIFFTQRDYHREIYQQLERRPSQVWIASFNLHVGISPRGGVFHDLDSHKFIDYVNSNVPNSRILIGLPDPKELSKVVNAAEYFPHISWKFSFRSHLKCWVFFHGKRAEALCGSRNLGDSDWANAVIKLNQPDSRRLLEFYNGLWIGSKAVPTTQLELRQ
jgi:hypothetical protein